MLPKTEEPTPEEPTPDTPDDEEEIETPEFDSDIPDVAIPGDEDLKEENADEWTNQSLVRVKKFLANTKK